MTTLTPEGFDAIADEIKRRRTDHQVTSRLSYEPGGTVTTGGYLESTWEIDNWKEGVQALGDDGIWYMLTRLEVTTYVEAGSAALLRDHREHRLHGFPLQKTNRDARRSRYLSYFAHRPR